MTSHPPDVSQIWDDESGDPPPMTIEEFDARREAATRRIRDETRAIQANTEKMERRIARLGTRVKRLDALMNNTDSQD